jgi:ATP-dependent phosphofructokinase / diphosphate-dependent phosphofructokinase
MTLKRIGLLNGGGDCPGLNAVIRAVVKTAILKYGWQVWASMDSFDGLIWPEEKLAPMAVDSVRGILPRGGTILGTTNRGNPFQYPRPKAGGETEFHDYSGRVMDTVRNKQLDALVVIGGDGTLTIANRFFEAGLPVVGVPKTIDNDLLVTEVSFGFNTALRTAMDAIDMLHTTAASHGRVMVVELMGRYSGWIALQAGIAGGADVILIPEIPFDIARVGDKIADREKAGRKFSIVVVAEGATPAGGTRTYQAESPEYPHGRLGGVGQQVAERLQEVTGMETRSLVLGHLQRGGSPNAFDRLLGTRFGVAAVELAAAGGFGRMVSLKCGTIDSTPIRDAVAHHRLVDPDGEIVAAAKALGIAFGD